MGIAATLCIGIGCFPGYFYSLLPFQSTYAPYTLEHVVAQVQLLFLSALAFTLLMRTGIYAPELRSVNLDFDWLYRRLGRALLFRVHTIVDTTWAAICRSAGLGWAAIVARVQRHHGPDGLLAQSWPAGVMAFWTTLILAAYLFLFYI
jgi:multicomponent Na+:H+ antiporter subunit D